METEINGHNGAIFIIIDHNNDHTVKDGNDRLVQSPGDKWRDNEKKQKWGKTVELDSIKTFHCAL